MNKEIERKYTINYLPKEMEIEEVKQIEQAYIYKDINTYIRIRKIETKQKIEYRYTIKTKGDILDNNYMTSKIYEIENNITKEEYEELLLKKIGNKIDKTRIVVPIFNNLKVECDIYYNYLEGFLTAEIEFPNEKEASQFVKPDWLGEEIGYKELSNQKLSHMNKEQINNKIGQEQLEHNKKIIEELNQLIKKCY